jgi:deazaflavin-dependent oxidoreductase (nitroreductase family)
MSKTHLLIHRLSRGRLLGRVAGMPVLLLTTTGRWTGKPRTTPLTYFRDGANLVVIASNGGADSPPDWSLNLQQNPRAVVKVGKDELTVQARTASPEKRERLWPGITATYPRYARYQKKTAREIPVLILTPERWAEPSSLKSGTQTGPPPGPLRPRASRRCHVAPSPQA